MKAAIERRTGTVFGFMRRTTAVEQIPPGTVYVRRGSGGHRGLCLFELGTSKWFLYFDRVAR